MKHNRDAKGNLVKFPVDTSTATLGSLNANIIVDVSGGFGQVAFQLVGTSVATVQAMASIDGGSTWFNTQIYSDGAGMLLNNVASTASANGAGVYRVAAGGVSQVKLTVSAYTSGSFACTALRSVRDCPSNTPVSIGNLIPPSIQIANVVGNVVPVLQTSTPLSGNATYISGSLTGPADLSFTQLAVVVSTNQAGTIYVDAYDGANWFVVSQLAVAASVPGTLYCDWITTPMRVRYTNGAAAQGTFWLYTYSTIN